MKIIITGGSGYIGSHTILELNKYNHEIYNIDIAVTNSDLTNSDLRTKKVDLLDKDQLKETLDSWGSFDCCIHFAALKSVGESFEKPLDYYKVNVQGTLNLLDFISCKHFIFSSSCAAENPVSVYGRSKKMVEDILSDISKTKKFEKITILRYYNPVGFDKSLSKMQSTNSGIFNIINDVIKTDSVLKIYKNSETPDKTGIRDYIHITDIAKAHIKVFDVQDQFSIINLGTGFGYSVLDIIKEFEKEIGCNIKYKLIDPLEGDLTNVVMVSYPFYKTEKTLTDCVKSSLF